MHPLRSRSTSLLLLWILFQYSCPGYGIPTVLKIEKIDFDADTKKFTVVYVNGGKEITLMDSGPVLLCVINRLLKDKYKPKEEISKDDLRILHHASYLLPKIEQTALSGAVKSYMRADPKDESKVFDTLVSSIRTGLKDHEADFVEKTTGDSEVTADEREKLKKLEVRIEALVGDSKEEDLEADEKALLKRLRADRDRLKNKIAQAKPATKTEKGKESPALYSLCVKDESSKSRTVISNKNVGELLGRSSDLLKTMLPDQAALPKTDHD